MTKRRILAAAVVISLLAILAAGSLAYFTDSKTIKNEFMMASFDPEHPGEDVDPDDLFSIKVSETDADGKETTTGRTYVDIAPGDVLDKDPTVTNTGSYDQYVRVTVTLTNAAAWQKACKTHNITSLESIFGGFSKTDWVRYDEPAYDTKKDTLTYVYYLQSALKPGADNSKTLFNKVTIPASFGIEDMVSLASFELNISADAIQTANTGSSAYKAFSDYWEN